ncbi:MAG TPA: hypothetical protein VF164_10020 [Trueperaceae bacterium]
MARRDNHQAARALAEWALEGFREAVARQIADTYGIATRTLWRWKSALDEDTELSGLFRDRLNDILDRDWAAHLTDALAELVQRIRTLAADEPDLGKVVEAFRALSEVEITREVLRGATDADPHRGHETASGQATSARAALPN